MERRDFLRVAGVGVAAALSAAGCRSGSSSSPAPSVPAGGPDVALGPADGNGLLLRSGYTSRVVATTGELVTGTGYAWHVAPDGGATFVAEDGGWIYVSNSEADPGGVGMVRFDRAGEVVDARRILDGTTTNCAGGATPWGTWLSCEETPTGRVWECDPSGVDPAVVRPAMGAFPHEAATVDPERQHVYLTEDQSDGGFYRFVPTAYPDLSSGTLEVLTEAEGALAWAAVPDPAGDPTPCRAQVPGTKAFNGGEGCWYERGAVHLTTKGDGRVWSYDPEANRLDVLYDAATSPDPVLTGLDNLIGAGAGGFFVAEDGGNMEICHLTAEGEVSVFLRLTGADDSEITGLALSPDRSRLYFSSQRSPGRTYEVRGPFDLA